MTHSSAIDHHLSVPRPCAQINTVAPYCLHTSRCEMRSLLCTYSSHSRTLAPLRTYMARCRSRHGLRNSSSAYVAWVSVCSDGVHCPSGLI